MQLISAVVRPHKVDDVCSALQLFGVRGLTVLAASGFGRRRGPAELYRGVDCSTGFQDQIKIEILCLEEDVRDVVSVICRVAATGGLGDGKVWVTPVTELVRIRTEEVGVAAL